MSDTPAPVRLARRQVALAGLTGTALLATGCTSGGADELQDLPRQAARDPDRGLVARARRAEQAMIDLLTATGNRHHQLRKQLRDALAVHRSHVRLLAGEEPGARVTLSGTPRIPSSAGTALAAVARAERSLQDAHAALALRAGSGAFARVLAGMAAAAAQQAAVLDQADPGSAGGSGS
jgi:hypothetical protein